MSYADEYLARAQERPLGRLGAFFTQFRADCRFSRKHDRALSHGAQRPKNKA